MALVHIAAILYALLCAQPLKCKAERIRTHVTALGQAKLKSRAVEVRQGAITHRQEEKASSLQKAAAPHAKPQETVKAPKFKAADSASLLNNQKKKPSSIASKNTFVKEKTGGQVAKKQPLPVKSSAQEKGGKQESKGKGEQADSLSELLIDGALLAAAQSSLASARMPVGPETSSTAIAVEIASGTGGGLGFLSALHVENLQSGSASGGYGYEEVLAAHLRGNLKLPEPGEVIVAVTVDASGGISSLKVLQGANTPNSTYIQKALPKLILPQPPCPQTLTLALVYSS